MAGEAISPRHSERKRRVFEAAGFLFEDSVCSVSALPQRQTVCRMTVDGGVQSDGEIQKERTLFEESAPFVILTVY